MGVHVPRRVPCVNCARCAPQLTVTNSGGAASVVFRLTVTDPSALQLTGVNKDVKDAAEKADQALSTASSAVSGCACRAPLSGCAGLAWRAPSPVLGFVVTVT